MTLDAEIREAALHLVGEIFRRHAMASRCDFLRLKNTAFQKFAREILVRISGHFSVRRQESGFRAKDQFVPAVPFAVSSRKAAPMDRSLRWKR